jgi:hypothetical protein
MDKRAEALGLLAKIGGGGLAGFLDTKFAATMPGGFPLGTVVAAGGIVGGLMGVGGNRIASALIDIGGGAAAFEFGTFVAQKEAAALTNQSAGVAGQLGPSRVVSSHQVMQSLAQLRNLQARREHMGVAA